MSYCEKCGASLQADSVFCSSCGTSLAPSTRSTPQATRTILLGSRPGGITILTLLQGITSVVMLIGGMLLVVLSTFLASGGWDLIPPEELEAALLEIPWASSFTGVPLLALTTSFLTGIGLILLVVAVLGFFMTWGLWSGKSWARTLTLVLTVISIVTGIFSLPGSLVSIIIGIVILYYLRRPDIQAYYR